ncbi:MAG: hypothetical protein ACPGQS_04985 [Bradymonadia bacterium]
MSHHTRLVPALFIVALSLFACKTDVPNTTPGQNTDSSEKLFGKDVIRAAQVESEDLGIAIEKANSSLQLYERALRLHKPSQNSSIYQHLLADGTSRSQAETTALLYLSDQRTERLIPPSKSSSAYPRRHNFSTKLREVCTMSQDFKKRLEAAFGAQVVTSVCPDSAAHSLALKQNQAGVIVREGLRARTATQRKHILLLATLDSPSALAPLIALPTINLGSPIKQLFGLDGLDIALISASTQTHHRTHLVQLLEKNELTERERSRVLFALAWHKEPKAQAIAVELFGKKRQLLKRSTESLIALAARIEKQETLQAILEEVYQWPNGSARFSEVFKAETIDAEFWGGLITRSLIKNVNHGLSWTDIGKKAIRPYVDIETIFEASVKSTSVEYLVRHLTRSDVTLTTRQCKLFHGRLNNTEPGHTLDALIKLLDQNKCITDEELETKMREGSPIATLLLGRRSMDSNVFFLNRLKAKDLKTVWSTAKGLLSDYQAIQLLTPPNAFAEQLALRLSPKKENFYVLRLLKTIVKKMSDDQRKQLSKSFITNLTPYANGKIGSIHPDALIVFELINTPQSISIIAKTLRNLKPGQVQIKLMNRFGHVLK